VKAVDGDIETHQRGAGIWWEEEERPLECKLRTYQDALSSIRELKEFSLHNKHFEGAGIA
jgi:hypothetical protein